MLHNKTDPSVRKLIRKYSVIKGCGFPVAWRFGLNLLEILEILRALKSGELVILKILMMGIFQIKT